MLKKRKQPSLEAGLLIILIVISLFSIGYYSEGKVSGVASTEVTGMASKQITGDMVRVSGMETSDTSVAQEEIKEGANQNVGDENWAWEKIKDRNVVYKARGNEYVDWDNQFFIGNVENHEALRTYQLIDNKVVGRSEDVMSPGYYAIPNDEKVPDMLKDFAPSGWFYGGTRTKLESAPENFGISSVQAPTQESTAPKPEIAPEPTEPPAEPLTQNNFNGLPTGTYVVDDQGNAHIGNLEGTIVRSGLNSHKGKTMKVVSIMGQPTKIREATQQEITQATPLTTYDTMNDVPNLGNTIIYIDREGNLKTSPTAAPFAKVKDPSAWEKTYRATTNIYGTTTIGKAPESQVHYMDGMWMAMGTGPNREDIMVNPQTGMAMINNQPYTGYWDKNLAKQTINMHKQMKRNEFIKQLQNQPGITPDNINDYINQLMEEYYKPTMAMMPGMPGMKMKKIEPIKLADDRYAIIGPDGIEFYNTNEGANKRATYLNIRSKAIKEGYRESNFYLQDGKTGLFTKDGIKFYQNPIDRPDDTEDILYKIDYIGLDDSIKITEQYTAQTKGIPKFESAKIGDIEINDRATLSELKSSVGSKGILSEEAGLIVVRRDDQPFQVFKLENFNPKTKTGSKLIYSFVNAYVSDEDSTVISEAEYNALSENEKEQYTLTHMVASTKGEEWVEGSVFVTIGKGTIEDGKIIYQEQTFDSKGDIWRFVYGEGTTFENSILTQVILDKDGNIIDIEGNRLSEDQLTEEQKKIVKRAQTELTQLKSRRWFDNFEFKLTQYKGLAGWSQLIFSDEELEDWREGVDQLFSTFYLGTDYWVSGICARYIPKQQKGLLTMKTKDGLFDIVAHVEGEKATITGPEETQYLYKLTFSVRNPRYSRYDELKFNVYLYGDKTVQLYPQSIEVKDGESFTRGAGKRENGQITYDEQHGKPIVQYSTYNYDKICIKFDSKILNAEGDREDEVCNAIVEYKGSPTKYQKKIIGTTAAGTPITAEPTEPYQEADF